MKLLTHTWSRLRHLWRAQSSRAARPSRLNVETLESRLVPAASPQPVLLVIANRDFYYQEYGDTRQSLEAAGLQVEVGAATLTPAVPHPNSGQGADGGVVTPDVILENVDASDYSAIVFVGGWGSSSYQYAFQGTYFNGHYNGSVAVENATNELINDFIDLDRTVAAICHGVTVLAWARVDGVSPIEGRTVSAYAHSSPGWSENGGQYPDTTRWHIESNGATMVASRSVGNPFAAADDVIVDGRIITAENFDSAAYFGEVIAEQVLADVPPENTPPHDVSISGPAIGVRNQPIDLAGSFVDEDEGDTHTLAWQVRDAGGMLVEQGTDTALTFTPTELGVYTVSFSVTDAAGAMASASRTLDIRKVALVAAENDSSRLNLLVGGSTGNDVIFVKPGLNAGEVKVVVNGTLLGTFAPTGRVMVFGGKGDDLIEGMATMTTPLWFDGGIGNDILKGGEGRDVLIGGKGADCIGGRGNRDLLVGGLGVDVLKGDATDWLFQEETPFALTPAIVDELMKD